MDGFEKGLGIGERGADGKWPAWSLLDEELSLPTAVLYAEKMEHNLRWMQRFIDAYGVKLAPHGKTTMAPKLFQMQLEHGAWGITLATAQQTLAAYELGVRRVLMANQLVGRVNMEIVARLLERGDFTYYCLVDSAEQVELLGAFFGERGLRINVLLEIGVDGGRCGVRDDAQIASVLEALQRSQGTVMLCGVELFEGVLKVEIDVWALLERAVAILRRLLEERRFTGSPVLLTAAGSAWYDVVAEIFTAAELGNAVEIVLRPGCYVTYDVGAYREAQTRILANNPVAQEMHGGLVPALQLWAHVLSRPEPETAIIGMGKRDASFDSGLPTPVLRYRPGMEAPTAVPEGWVLTRMMDQHAFLWVSAEDDVRAGDMIGFDISHPCLTFDKWRALPVVNEQYCVVDVVETYF
ncbi:amino acid deaminase [Acidicapsa dinghuensis]|uniref:Amino acid deaminase n=1 Tax=Acidicapsa dinghuensis TaxID=2218256 RepID=A0ABW1ED45_9BACT|nr:amino acid deaminase [Acidicapsa dinghuensis]